MKHSIILLKTDKQDKSFVEYQGKLGYGKYNPIHVSNECKRFHLYILSKDEIKKDDYFVNLTSKNIFKNDMGFDLSANYPNEQKIIVSSNKSLGLPWIDDEFIQEFVKAYNAGTSITEVELEMEEFLLTTKDDILDSKGTAEHIWKPKIKSDGSVIIKI